MQTVVASNGVSFLQMRSVGTHSTSGKEKKGNKERTGRAGKRVPDMREKERLGKCIYLLLLLFDCENPFQVI